MARKKARPTEHGRSAPTGANALSGWGVPLGLRAEMTKKAHSGNLPPQGARGRSPPPASPSAHKGPAACASARLSGVAGAGCPRAPISARRALLRRARPRRTPPPPPVILGILYTQTVLCRERPPPLCTSPSPLRGDAHGDPPPGHCRPSLPCLASRRRWRRPPCPPHPLLRRRWRPSASVAVRPRRLWREASRSRHPPRRRWCPLPRRL